MAAIYRAQSSGGGTSGTVDRTATTPILATGDLLFVVCIASGNTNAAPICSDNGTGGAYDLLAPADFATGVNMCSLFVRRNLITSADNAATRTVTVATGSNTAAEIGIIAVAGSVAAGAGAVRQAVALANQNNAGGTVTPAISFLAPCLTGNMTIAFEGCDGAPTTPPVSWSVRISASQSTPTTFCQANTRDTGFTGTTITWNATTATHFALFAVELSNYSPIAGTSALTVDQTGALDGAGALVGTAPVVLGQTGTLAGAGALAGSGALVIGQTGTLIDVAGSGAIIGAAALTIGQSGTLVGAGHLVGTSALAIAQAGTLAGAGHLTGTGALTVAATGVLAGAGHLAGAAALTFGASGTVHAVIHPILAVTIERGFASPSMTVAMEGDRTSTLVVDDTRTSTMTADHRTEVQVQ